MHASFVTAHHVSVTCQQARTTGPDRHG